MRTDYQLLQVLNKQIYNSIEALVESVGSEVASIVLFSEGHSPEENVTSTISLIVIDIAGIHSSPSVKTCFYGGRSFPSAAADLWNNLPESVKSVNTTERFKRVLKTHLFTP